MDPQLAAMETSSPYGEAATAVPPQAEVDDFLRMSYSIAYATK